MVFFTAWFAVFFGIVLVLYWTIARGSALRQNIILFLAGTFFYGWLDLRFLGLMLGSGLLNFVLARGIDAAPTDRQRRLLFWCGIGINLAALAYFKYFEFFVNSMLDVLGLFGIGHAPLHLGLLLPLGISFYTFRMLGYLIDVNNGTTEANKRPLEFMAYTVHFPLILAGPVERAPRFLARIAKARVFDPAMAHDAGRQLLWGLFAKVALADNLAPLVDEIHADPHNAGASTLALGAMLYVVQLLADFSGYSNMAIGLSKLLGVPLGINFRYPLFAVNISDFWQRWHISLTSWMMDYLFTPISFVLRDHGKRGLLIAIVATFMAVGIWHGANWTYVVFGAIQSLLFVPVVLRSTVARPPDHASGPWHLPPTRALRMLAMFLLTSFNFVLLRANDMDAAWVYWTGLFSTSLFRMPEIPLLTTAPLLLVFFSLEWYGQRHEHALSQLGMRWPTLLRWCMYAGLMLLITLSLPTEETAFIYIRF